MRQLSIGRALLVGTMVATTLLLVNVAISIATDSPSLMRWLTAPIAGTLAAVASAVEQQRRPARERPDPLPTLLVPKPTRKPGGLRRRFQRLVALAGGPTLTTAVIASVVILGAGGTVVAMATQYGMGWVTGNEHGPDRLARPTKATASGLTITVTRFEQTPHFTRVSVEVHNETGVSISLPVGEGNALLVAGDGTTRRADGFRSDWTESVSSGATRAGTITFAGHLPADSNRARLTFVTVFGYGDNLPASLTVSGIQLKPG